ncbi:MAG: RHS repeat-associated core domain-containing protein [Chloroflexi bacterium]|nr:RHS repeat-associated core domain-containing protein [Chloroflexota bacterium]
MLYNNAASSGYKIRFKELSVPDEFDVQTVQYTYDPLARLVGAHYYHGENLTSGLFRQYEHKFDAAGNRFREKIFLDGATAPAVHDRYYYGDANHLTEVKDNILSQSVYPTYDAAGRMTSDGTNALTWDAEGRLLTARGVSYTYNGLGQRIGLNDGTAYDFILDTQPGLYNVLRKTWNSGANKQSFVHGPMGILRRQLNDGSWREYVTDGLGSVRQELDSSLNPANYHHYEPYGEIFAQSGSDMPYNFTGQPLDSNGLLHLRARYLMPELGVFPSLDPVEGGLQAMSALNRYAYVAGNVINVVDLSGMTGETPPVSCNVFPHTDNACPEDSTNRLSDQIINPTSSYETNKAWIQATRIIRNEITEGGNCGVKILYNLSQKNPSRSLDLLEHVASIAGWKLPASSALSYDPGRVDPYGARGLVGNDLEVQIETACAGKSDEEREACAQSTTEKYVVAFVAENIAHFGTDLFLLGSGSNDLRPATGDVVGTYIEEVGHTWQNTFDNKYLGPNEREYQVKFYKLGLVESGRLFMSADNIRLECFAIEEGYASIRTGIGKRLTHLGTLGIPTGWPREELWPIFVPDPKIPRICNIFGILG